MKSLKRFETCFNSLTAGWKDRWERGGGLSAPWAAASDATDATDTPGPRARVEGPSGVGMIWDVC